MIRGALHETEPTSLMHPAIAGLQARLALLSIVPGLPALRGLGAATREIRFAAEWADALAARAGQIHGVLDTTAQGLRTTALDTPAGRIVAGGGVDLSLAQRAVLGAGEVAAKAPGVHDEVTAILGARQIGAQLRAIGTTRDFCPFCVDYIEQSGGVITGPRTAVWPQ